MNKRTIALTAAMLAVAGCDDKQRLEPVSPMMAGFSNIFGFDALRGKIKRFTQTQTDEQGKVVAYVAVTLNQNGCVDTLKSYQPTMNLDLDLVREGQLLVDRNDRKPAFQLGKDCLLEKSVDGRLIYRHDDKGFITDVFYNGHTTPFATYQYDDDGFPSDMTFTSPESGKVTLVSLRNDAAPGKRLDSTMSVTENGEQTSITRTTCRYDVRFNPVVCRVLMTNGKGAGQTLSTLTNTTKVEYR
ncbi:YnfC family lipoprotein [Musicola paradisiaca]|uniref:UPF0257 lipoprotein Dd703_3247 n=1 Tax=Musicola paradisiaca (strain Ech703) TaxID=579405 RepID=C6CDD8_MUSP7|nr:YnfC family lipoprotein [Musicola paradisiaca]ACS87009.1 lipoprotein YnfC [Musicola paradisiaca Ech703]